LKKISYWIRNYFGFSQKEAAGFILLVVFILFFLFLPVVYNRIINSESPDYTSDQRKLDSLILKIEPSSLTKDATHKQTSFNLHLSNFNPNQVNKEEMLSLGFEKKIAERIINFRNMGGSFKTKKDLLKIYGLPNDFFNKLQPFILLPDSIIREKSRSPKEVFTFDINKTDTIQLNLLKGIGQILAARIIKYRDKLGGFINKDQFNEVYGLSPPALDELKKHAFITNEFVPVKLDINNADKKTLSDHPYITNKMAVSIINFRQQHGFYKTVENIREIKSLSEEDMRKLLPYFSVTPTPD
jgi:competence protein ComEA